MGNTELYNEKLEREYWEHIAQLENADSREYDCDSESYNCED